MNINTDQTAINTHSSKLSTSDLALIALFTAVMAVCSWISIPATIPFTMQTFGVFLTAALLGGKRGTLTVLVYLLLGTVGLPVFSGFTGGIGHLFSATGGYLAGFILTALIMWLAEHLFGRSMPVLAVSMVLGLIVCYAFGTAWFVNVYTKSTGDVGVMTALGWCVFPYIIPDLAKIVLALLLTRRLRPFIDR